MVVAVFVLRPIQQTHDHGFVVLWPHLPVVVHVLPQERDRRLRSVLLDEGHVEVVHEENEPFRTRRAVGLAAPLRNESGTRYRRSLLLFSGPGRRDSSMK